MSIFKLFYQKWIHGTYIYRLDEAYSYFSEIRGYAYENKWLKIEPEGLITIKAGYAWDGCTPKINILDLFIFGTPEGVVNKSTMKPKTYYASLVHDALLQFYGKHGIGKNKIDSLFYDILMRDDFYLARLYFIVVSKLGHLFFMHYTIRRDADGNEWIDERICDE